MRPVQVVRTHASAESPFLIHVTGTRGMIGACSTMVCDGTRGGISRRYARRLVLLSYRKCVIGGKPLQVDDLRTIKDLGGYY